MALDSLVKNIPPPKRLEESKEFAQSSEAFEQKVKEAEAQGSEDPTFDAIFGAYDGQADVNMAFVVPSAIRRKTVSEADVLATTGILKMLLSQRDSIKTPSATERAATQEWRSKFYAMLNAMSRPDAYESLDWLLRTFDDLTDPATALLLRNKVAEWPHLGEQYIGAIAVGYLLLGGLRRELEKLESDTQEKAAQNVFDTFDRVKVQEVDDKGKIKEKKPVASAISLSEKNQRLARIRLNGDDLFALEEQIDYVERLTKSMESTYELMQRVSYQNQALSGMARQQGA